MNTFKILPTLKKKEVKSLIKCFNKESNGTNVKTVEEFAMRAVGLKTKLVFIENEEYKNTTITLTFGEQSENHKGMQIKGDGLADHGYTIDELRKIQKKLKKVFFTPVIEMENICLEMKY